MIQSTFSSDQGQMISLEAKATWALWIFIDLAVMKLQLHDISLPNPSCLLLSRLMTGAMTGHTAEPMTMMHESKESMLFK